MELEGLGAVYYLRGHGTVRDGALVSLLVKQLNAEPVVELVFEIPHQSRIVKLELRDIQEFEYGYSKQTYPEVFPLVKCLMTDAGDFFLSLDPYDEREEFISDKDNEFFRSRFVRLTESRVGDFDLTR